LSAKARTPKALACTLKIEERRMIMGKINSKQKGARFERQLASLFRDYGYTDARRTAQYCGNTGDASDVVGLPGIHIEAKHQERMQLYDWMEQAERDAKGTNQFPVVFHKKNNADILVTMKLEDWMELYKEYDAAQALKDGD
jgi:Holliday junction resolvase